MLELSPRFGLGEKLRKNIVRNTSNIVLTAGATIVAFSIGIGVTEIVKTNNVINAGFTRSLEEVGLSRESYSRAKSRVLFDIRDQVNQAQKQGKQFAEIAAIEDKPQNKKDINAYIQGRTLEQKAGDQYYQRKVDTWGLLICGIFLGLSTIAGGFVLKQEQKENDN